MLNLTELKRVAALLAECILGHRLQGVVQFDDRSAVLTIYGSGEKRHLFFGCGRETARVSQLDAVPKALATPPAFVQYLRAHGVGGVIRSVELLDEDRQVSIRIEKRTDSGLGGAEVVLSILGPRSNLYVLDAERVLVAAVRPLFETRTELALGAPWRSPEARPPRVGEDRFADVPDAELLSAIEARYGAADRESGSASLQRKIEQALNKRRKALDRKLEKLEVEIEGARQAIECEREGELLKGELSRVKKGDTEVVARDHDRGKDVAIALDPMKSPSENLELIFKRYRKGVRTLTKGGAQEAAVRADHREVAAEQEAYLELVGEGGPSDEDLEVFAQRPLVSRLLSRFAPASGEPKRGGAAKRRGGPAPDRKFAGRMVPTRLMPRRYQTAGGLEIWVGRSDAANDFLSTRLARGKDLFFHLDGAPGSHVILRTQGRVDPPSEAILDACELAVHFSKAKNATRADVHIVPIANVKKPRGAKPGLVMVHGGRSLHLRRIPARLERALKARIEE